MEEIKMPGVSSYEITYRLRHKTNRIPQIQIVEARNRDHAENVFFSIIDKRYYVLLKIKKLKQIPTLETINSYELKTREGYAVIWDRTFTRKILAVFKTEDQAKTYMETRQQCTTPNELYYIEKTALAEYTLTEAINVKKGSVD